MVNYLKIWKDEKPQNQWNSASRRENRALSDLGIEEWKLGKNWREEWKKSKEEVVLRLGKLRNVILLEN